MVTHALPQEHSPINPPSANRFQVAPLQRGLGVAAGTTRTQGAWLGVGQRSGNTWSPEEEQECPRECSHLATFRLGDK